MNEYKKAVIAAMALPLSYELGGKQQYPDLTELFKEAEKCFTDEEKFRIRTFLSNLLINGS